MNAMRMAVSSGRGIGKSALVSWLILWMLTTRIGSTVIVSANSENQLRTVTWGELTKWATMSINNHWWEISATKLIPAAWITDLVERDLKLGTRYWAAEGLRQQRSRPDRAPQGQEERGAGVASEYGAMLRFDDLVSLLLKAGYSEQSLQIDRCKQCGGWMTAICSTCRIEDERNASL
jgi:hypothetical protein